MIFNDKQALILDNCTIKEYLTIFSEKPSDVAIECNEILKEHSLSDIKELMIKQISLISKKVTKYSAGIQAELLYLDFELQKKIETMNVVDLQQFNNYLISVFRASDQKIDKSISMLDFYNIENQVIKEQKEIKLRTKNK